MNAPLDTAVQPPVLREDAGGVATLTLNRPAQFNAINGALLIELQAALDAIAGDPTVRVVVIAGAGRAFCPGHDLKEMLAHSNEAYIGDLFRRCCDVMLSIRRLPQPWRRRTRDSLRRASTSGSSVPRLACPFPATSRQSGRSRC
jgi:enoyl-CoA hydratase/carnithine racemase